MDQKLFILAYVEDAKRCNTKASNIIRGRFEYIASKEAIDEKDPDVISYRYIQRGAGRTSGYA